MNGKNNVNAYLNRCLKPGESVITTEKGEIGKCCTNACVAISGIPFDDNASFYKELNLWVVTKRCCKKVPLKPGYNPNVELLDFNGCGNEIYVTIDSGGSGGFQFFYIFEYDNCKLNLLMSDDIFNAEYNKYEGRYIDYFRAQVEYRERVWRIDLSCKGSDYLSQIYNPDGSLIEPKKIYISGANYTFPQYFTPDDKYNLVVYQEITGLYQADTLGYMETTLKFENGTHSPLRIYLKTLDNDRFDCIAF